MNLRHAAFRLRREIQHIIASTPHSEIPGRIEDVVHDAFAELADNTRRAVRREHAAGE
jgi:hypothetical protein